MYHPTSTFPQTETCHAQRAHGEQFVHLHPARLFLLSMMGGGLICIGANLSLAFSLGDGIAPGPRNLLLSLGFYAGFGMVILTGSALFTEVNVGLPFYLALTNRKSRKSAWHVALVWFLVWAGNVVGTMLTACLIVSSGQIDETMGEYLNTVAQKKLYMYYSDPSVRGWFQVFLSAMLGNWMVGIAAMLASSAKSAPGKLMSIILPISSFVSLGMQHSPANMAYMHLNLIYGDPLMTWGVAWGWNIVPASLGNMLGATVFVVATFYFAFVSQTPTNLPYTNAHTASFPNKSTTSSGLGDGASSSDCGSHGDPGVEPESRTSSARDVQVV